MLNYLIVMRAKSNYGKELLSGVWIQKRRFKAKVWIELCWKHKQASHVSTYLLSISSILKLPHQRCKLLGLHLTPTHRVGFIP